MTPIRGIIWDLDGTLYRYAPESLPVFVQAAAKAAVELGVPLSVEDAYRVGLDSFWAHGHITTAFLQDYGLDQATLTHHLLLHIREDEVCVPLDGVREALDSLVDVKHLILTHGARAWALRMLEHIGVRAHFPDERILAMDDAGMVQKNQAPDAFLRSLEVMGLEAAEVVVIEDSVINLVHAHSVGLATVFIHHGEPLETLPEYVHQQYETPVAFLASLK